MPSYQDLVVACRALDVEPIAALALDLVSLWTPPGSESPMAERMAAELEAAGARVTIDRTFPSSPSVIAEFGATSGPTLQWHGHLDAIDAPHADARRDGDLIRGRGAADMKGPDAAMVAAARLLIDHGMPAHGRVLITLHGMHESGGNEPLHELIARGIHGDAVITGELGGGQHLPIAGLGLTFWTITVTRPGTSLHEIAAPAGTIDTVEVGRLLHQELAALRDRLLATPDADPPPSLFVGQFTAGDYVNTMPVRAVLRGTRRHTISSTQEEVDTELRELVARVARETGADIDIDVVRVADAFEVDPQEDIVVAMQTAHRDLTGAELPVSRSRVATNAVHFVQEAGIPAVGYGPDPATNHSDDETLAVSELSRIAAGFALGTARYFERIGDGR